jgi:hypothetical protein
MLPFADHNGSPVSYVVGEGTKHATQVDPFFHLSDQILRAVEARLMFINGSVVH